MSRVLMVDDAGLFRMLETSFLRRFGCEIQRAGSTPDILRKATDGYPSLILLDAQRPDLNGPECVRALKSDPALRAIPVLVVAGADDVKACCEAGADATLTRPIEPGALELALSSLDRMAHRDGARRSAPGWVRVMAPSGPQRGRLKDISRTGLFVALPEPLPMDQSVGLSLRLPGSDGQHRVKAQGRVVRQVRADPDSHLIAGVGVRFVEIDPHDEMCIDHFVRGTIVEADPSEDASGGRDRS